MGSLDEFGIRVPPARWLSHMGVRLPRWSQFVPPGRIPSFPLGVVQQEMTRHAVRSGPEDILRCLLEGAVAGYGPYCPYIRLPPLVHYQWCDIPRDMYVIMYACGYVENGRISVNSWKKTTVYSYIKHIWPFEPNSGRCPKLPESWDLICRTICIHSLRSRKQVEDSTGTFWIEARLVMPTSNDLSMGISGNYEPLLNTNYWTLSLKSGFGCLELRTYRYNIYVYHEPSGLRNIQVLVITANPTGSLWRRFCLQHGFQHSSCSHPHPLEDLTVVCKLRGSLPLNILQNFPQQGANKCIVPIL